MTALGRCSRRTPKIVGKMPPGPTVVGARSQPADVDPTYGAAYNDLAVAYEHEGQLDKARRAYEKALEVEPDNAQIRQNYDLFKEIHDRTSVVKEQP